MAEVKRYRVRLVVKDLKSLQNIDADFACMPIRQREDGMIETEAIIAENVLARLRKIRRQDMTIEVLADRTQEAAESRKLMSTTNRYADGSLPTGPGSRGRRVP